MNDEIELKTGTLFYSNQRIVGIDDGGRVFEGYDGGVHDDDWTLEDRAALAEMMFARWAAYAPSALAQAPEVIALIQTAVEAERTALGVGLADALDAGAREHKQNYPDGRWKDANIALGGLRKIAAIFWPETLDLGNAECAAAIRASDAPASADAGRAR